MEGPGSFRNRTEQSQFVNLDGVLQDCYVGEVNVLFFKPLHYEVSILAASLFL